MKLLMYDASVPVFLSGLDNLPTVLKVGAAHAEAHNIGPAVLLGSRLYPDMFPLSRQVQIACDMVKNGTARLGGMDPPSKADTESTFPELQARIEWTQDYLRGFKPGQINGSEQRAILLKTPLGELNFLGHQYLFGFILPNLYFHSATAYNILRHSGVPLSKTHFIGKP